MTIRSILLAEDDELVRAVLSRVLGELSENVAIATSGDEAIRLLDENSFEVIVTDLNMPGASGLDLIDKAYCLGHKPRVVVISGYADDKVKDHVEALGGALLHKPFGSSDLRKAILGLSK